MIKVLDIDNFLELSSVSGAIVDVRSGGEFARGHLRGAVNIELFSNDERAEVGTLYVKSSRQAAIDKGLEFVGPKMASIVSRARELGGEIFIYCARGGMRSGSVAWLLDMAGIKVSVLRGGYKAYRRNFERLLDKNWQFVVVGGATGSGKSEILEILASKGEQVIDLEGIAHHKGSAFGHLGQIAQPSSETFINELHEKLRMLDSGRIVWCEGESMLIGHLFLPQKFFGVMERGRHIEVVMDVDARLDRLVVEYGCFGVDELSVAFEKIGKRLGYDNVKAAIEMVRGGDVRGAARVALTYYDKAYARSGGDKIDIQVDISSDMDANAIKLIKIVE